MAQRLRALTALQKVLSSIPKSHTVARNHLEWDQVPSSGASEESKSVLIYIKSINLKQTNKQKVAARSNGTCILSESSISAKQK